MAAHPLPSSDDLSEEERNTIYVGLSSLVPEHLHRLCICAQKRSLKDDLAGLFFGRLICKSKSKKIIRLEIAALPHYFEADEATYERHVRTITLTTAQFAQLLEYDRRLAGMATCDVRDCLLEHIEDVEEQIKRVEQSTAAQSDQLLGTGPVHTEVQACQTEASRSQRDHDQPKEMKVIHTVSLSIETIKAAVSQEERYHADKQQKWTPRASNIHVVAIVAALLAAKQRRDSAQSNTQRRVHSSSVKTLRRVLQERRQHRPVVEPELRDGNVVMVRISVPVA